MFLKDAGKAPSSSSRARIEQPTAHLSGSTSSVCAEYKQSQDCIQIVNAFGWGEGVVYVNTIHLRSEQKEG